MSANLAAILYLIAGVCFIMALRGLSSPGTARRGNLFGIAGMVIAVGTTLAQPSVEDYLWIIIGIVVGGAIGTLIALRIQMTAMPQLVAAFHSLVGLAAVLVAAAALNTPEAYGIGSVGAMSAASLIEMSLGSAIGAITFSGSVVAFTKLQGLVSGRPVVFSGQHPLNAALGIAMVVLIVWFCASEAHTAFWALTILAFVIGVLIIIPIGGADMPVVVSMLNSYSGWAAAGIGFTIDSGTGLHVVNYLAFDSLGIAPTATLSVPDADVDPGRPGIQVQEGSTITVLAELSDDVQVRDVELLLDGRVLASEAAFPWDFAAVMPLLALGSDTATL